MARDFERLTPADIPPVHAEVKYNDIARLKPQLAYLLTRMHDNIEENRYGVMIGDDTGGRVPALILSRVLNSLNHKRGLPAIPTFFVQGGRHTTIIPYIEAVIKKHQHMMAVLGEEQKVLLVTEHVASGDTLKQFRSVFTAESIPYDVAVVYSSQSEIRLKSREALDRRSSLYVGNIYDKSHMNTSFLDFQYTGINNQKYASPKFIEDPEMRKNARDALRDAKHIAEELLVFYQNRYYSDNQQ